MKRAIILVLDSFGIGATADANKYGDAGASTLGHIAQACADGTANDSERQGVLHLPNMNAFGLAQAFKRSTGHLPAGFTGDDTIISAYGLSSEISSGKDTTSGHWEIAGVPVLFDWGVFPDHTNSFPPELLDKIVKKANLKGYLGNCHASGTQVLDDLGVEHMQTGKPIFYTSADSVFQVACHEETYGLDNLIDLCQLIREELDGYNIGRVIARPFVGNKAGEFERTGNRRDFSVEPPSATVLQKLVDEKQGDVISIGKIADIYAHCGITKKIKANGIPDLFDATIDQIKQADHNSIVFTNFVDFDAVYGHRRDVIGYAKALEYFDKRLPEILPLLQQDDILIVTSDHGCDPTWHGTDHTREHIPIMVYGHNIPSGFFGHRDTFADIGQSLAQYFGLSPMEHGTSFLK